MRNIRALAMVVVSLVAGFAALTLATRWLNAQSVVSTNSVVVAAVDLRAGQQINEQQVRTIDWPAGNIPAGAFQSAVDIKDRVARNDIIRDEPILETKLAPAGELGGMAAIIKEGKRAITVRVNDVVGVAGFALPGTFVDIMVNISKRASGQDLAVSKIVLERILVLAVAQEASRDDTQPKVVNAVTLEVSPDEAEKIDLARSVGNLSLVLRNNVDDDSIVTAGATSDLLLGIQKKTAPPAKVVRTVTRVRAKPAAPEQVCVDAWSGSELKRECF